MPLRLDIKRQLSARSDRVKCVDLHPTEPWMFASLYNGSIHVWNFETQTMIKSFEVTDLPIRAARCVQRKNWLIVGADDMLIRVFNYNTLEKLHTFEAHSDYIRSIAVHPTQPYLLSSSDDMTIKLWDWDKKWQCVQVFEGHTHYVMSVMFNPKDTNTFASCSLDRTIKVWQLGSATPNFTLQGHDKGVNCLDYYQGGEKPYLVTGGDDRLVKIWDYQNKTCVQTLDGHTNNVCAVCFHPELPIILTGSEDGTVRIWHANTYRLENTLNYGLERVWCMAYRRGSNSIAIGYDEGSILIKLGREEPAISMDSSGKVVWAKHNELQQAIVAKIDDIKDGEPLPIATKELGSCEIYPQTLQHNSNGRFVVVCGDGEYIILTALKANNKAFGQALDFAWAPSSEYAIRENTSKVKIFKNFKEKKTLKLDSSAEGLFGGHLLAVKGAGSLSFFDWESGNLVRRVEIEAKNVFWSDTGSLVVIASEESFYVLKYNAEAVASVLETGEGLDEDGIEAALDVLSDVPEVVKTGKWVGDCFIYTNSVNRLNYYVGGEIVTIAHLDRTMYLLGYLDSTNRVYLCDKDVAIVSYRLELAVLQYQTAVMRGDLESADKIIPTISRDQRSRVAHFLEKQGFKEQALLVSVDAEHRFDLAVTLRKLDTAREIAKELDSEAKWRQLGDIALRACRFDLAEECLDQAKDYSGLLLLYSCGGKGEKLAQLAEKAAVDGRFNIAFSSFLLLGQSARCVELLCETQRYPEAAFFARSYCPSALVRVMDLWKGDLAKTNQKASDALAVPTQYENLFPAYSESLGLEEVLRQVAGVPRPSTQYMQVLEERRIPLSERVASNFYSDLLGSSFSSTVDDEQFEESAKEQPMKHIPVATPHHHEAPTPAKEQDEEEDADEQEEEEEDLGLDDVDDEDAQGNDDDDGEDLLDD